MRPWLSTLARTACDWQKLTKDGDARLCFLQVTGSEEFVPASVVQISPGTAAGTLFSKEATNGQIERINGFRERPKKYLSQFKLAHAKSDHLQGRINRPLH